MLTALSANEVVIMAGNARPPIDNGAVLITGASAGNVLAVAQLTTALVPAMVKRGRGGVLNMGSGAGLTVMPAAAAYSASKHFMDTRIRRTADDAAHRDQPGGQV
jgi:hypothetical protein